MTLDTAWPGSRAVCLPAGLCSCRELVSMPLAIMAFLTLMKLSVDCYRNKTRSAMESIMQDVKTTAPHYETRVGKRRFNERMRSGEKEDES